MKAELEFKGYSYGYGASRGMFISKDSEHSLEKLLELGVNYICLCVREFIDDIHSTDIVFHYDSSLTDYEVCDMIARIKAKGVSVCLKPMIDSKDHEWRARVDFGDDAEKWNDWFKSYNAFILHYAEIAARTDCEMFCLGCEMLGMEPQEAHWRYLIGEVRKIYKGKLTYNTNHHKELVAKWYDAIDYIGTSAYYPVAREGGASVEEMEKGWEYAAKSLDKVYEYWKKPIIFMEIGCRSALGCATMPWDFEHREFPLSLEEQANFFESAMNVMEKKEWFRGFFWWDWPIKLYPTEEGKHNNWFCIHGKPAEDVVKEHYKG